MGNKAWLVIAALLVALGLIIFVVVMAGCGWDFSRLSPVKYETNTYDITEDFDSISINACTADIIFTRSEDGEGKVVCYEEENMKHTVRVKDGRLEIEVVDASVWYERIFSFKNPKLTVYLPEGEYGALSIESDTGDILVQKDFRFESINISASTGDITSCASAKGEIRITTSTGDIRAENLSADSLALSATTGDVTAESVSTAGSLTLSATTGDVFAKDISSGELSVSVSTGDTALTDINCKSLVSKGSTGDIFLNNVIAEESFSIERSTGDIVFNSSDAAEIFVVADTGDVTGSLLSEKVFIPRSDTGRIDVPKTASGGRCEITTDTGDIRITIK